MKRKTIISSVIIVIIILCLIIGYILNKNINNYANILKLNWNIELPEDAEIREILIKKENTSSHGDGIRFHIFAYENEDKIEKMLNWSIEEKETLFYSSYRETINEWLNQINISNKYIPNYFNCQYWYNFKFRYFLERIRNVIHKINKFI